MNSELETETQLPKRPRFSFSFRYSLRFIIALVTIGCIVIGYYSHRANQQKEGREWLNELENNSYDIRVDKYVSTSYVFQFERDQELAVPYEKSEPAYPKWLVDALGVDYFGSVVYVYIIADDPKPIELTNLMKFRGLRLLQISGTQVEDFSELKQLKNLETILLDQAETKGLDGIQELSNLTSVGITGSPYVKSIEPISGLLKLESLTLFGTSVEDLSPLSKLIELRTLDLSGTNVSDLCHLSNLKKLESVILRNTKVSDLSPLDKLKLLGSVDVTGSLVDEAERIRFESVSSALILDHDD